NRMSTPRRSSPPPLRSSGEQRRGDPANDPYRQHLILNAFLMSTGHHEASWRLPESDPFANTDVAHYQRLAQIAERGKLDSVFFADSPVLFSDVGRRPAGSL